MRCGGKTGQIFANRVGTLDTGFADPDMEALRQKLNEMILNGRRWGSRGVDSACLTGRWPLS